MKQITSEIKQQQIEWRRAKVLELSSLGYSEREIAEKLQPIAPVTVHRDLVHLRQQAQDNLQRHIHEVVPEEYQKCMVGTGVDNVTATTTATATTSNNFLQYENSTYGIKIQYPDNWQTKPANGILGEIVFFLPQGVNQTRDQVELDISVIPSRNMPLDPLAQRLFEIYKTILPSLEIIESTQITFHGNPALMVLVNSTNPISGIVKSINIFTIKYGNLYLISYSAKPEIYSAYLPIANKMIDSFQIIKPSTGYNNNLTKNITTPGNVTGNNNTMTTTTPSSSSTSNFLTYENSTYGIRVQYPSDWELEEKDYYAGDGVTDIIQLF